MGCTLANDNFGCCVWDSGLSIFDNKVCSMETLF